MTPKELKRLSRRDLLEMLLELSRENEEIRGENTRLRSELENRNVAIEESGSLAEAALRLNGVFQAAQEACDQYTRNIQSRNADLEQNCRSMEQQTKEKCDEMLAQAQAQAEDILAQARTQAEDILAQIRQEKDRRDQTYLWLAGILNGSEE